MLIFLVLNASMLKRRKRGPPKPAGRPVTIDAAYMIAYRVDADTVHALIELSKRWNCSKSEALRRAIKTVRDSKN